MSLLITTCKTSRLKDVQTNEVKFFCIEKSHQSILANPMAENYGTFEEQTRIPRKLIIEETSNRWKETEIQKKKQFLKTLVHADKTTTKRGLLQQKHPNWIHSWSNQFWNPIANFSVKVEYERTSTSNVTHRWKNIWPISDATMITKTMNKKKRIQSPSLMSEQRLRTRCKICMHLQNFRCFPDSTGQKHESVTRMATNERVQYLTLITTFKKQLQC